MAYLSVPLAHSLFQRGLSKSSKQLLSLASNVFIADDKCQLAYHSSFSAFVVLSDLPMGIDFLHQFFLDSAVLRIFPVLSALHHSAELSICIRLLLRILSLLKQQKVLLLERLNLAQELLLLTLLLLDSELTALS